MVALGKDEDYQPNAPVIRMTTAEFSNRPPENLHA
jgi:hypothetical protein